MSVCVCVCARTDMYVCVGMQKILAEGNIKSNNQGDIIWAFKLMSVERGTKMDSLP